MIDDLDRTLERLLRDRVPLPTEHIDFAPPVETYRNDLPQVGLTVNVYLYDLRENHELREYEWRLERQPNGDVRKIRPKARIDFSYLVTVWSREGVNQAIEEHALLGEILRTLLRYETVPPELLQGELAGQQPPLPTLVAQPDGLRHAAEFWGALRQPPRPAINLVVTVSVEPKAAAEPETTLRPVVSRQIGVGQVGAMRFDLTIRPPLAATHAPELPVRRMTVLGAPAARLQDGIFAARDRITATLSGSLPSNAWLLIDDVANREFVRIGLAPSEAAGEQVIPLATPLRFAHDPAAAPIPLRVVRPVEAPPRLTRLRASVAAGAATLQVRDREGIVVGDGLELADGERSEVVAVRALSGALAEGTVEVEPALRYAHPSDIPVYRRRIEPAAANLAQQTVLAAPAGMAGNQVTLDQDVAPAGTILMVGTGPAVEFVRLEAAATAGTAVAVQPPLRGNHAAGTPVRRLTPAGEVGALAQAAAAGGASVGIVGTAVRRPGQAPLDTGEVVQIDGTLPDWAQVTAIAEGPPALLSPAESFVAIGGTVTNDATPPGPVTGARVTLRELGLMATTDASGRFTFANLQPGTYRLAVSATGYADAPERPVAVPAETIDEYRVVLSP